MSKSKQRKSFLSVWGENLLSSVCGQQITANSSSLTCVKKEHPSRERRLLQQPFGSTYLCWVASFFCYDQNKAKRPAVLGEKKKEWQCSAVKHCMCYCFQFGRSWIQIVKLLTKQSLATNSQTHSKSAKSSMKCFSLNPSQAPREDYVSRSGAHVSKMAAFWKSFGKTKRPKSFLSVLISLRRVKVGRSFGERPTAPPSPLRPVSVRIIRQKTNEMADNSIRILGARGDDNI